MLTYTFHHGVHLMSSFLSLAFFGVEHNIKSDFVEQSGTFRIRKDNFEVGQSLL